MRFQWMLLSILSFVLVAVANRRHERYSKLLNRKSLNAASSIIEYGPIWAGAVWDKDTNGTFTFVTGKFTVPVPSGQNGSAATAWVGIDGGPCWGFGGLLQAGVDFNINDGGEVTYNGWYEWYPDWSYNFDNFSISAGDVIRVNITSFTPKKGLTTIENLSTGVTKSKYLNSTYVLCGQQAEWIVEDFEDAHDNIVPFANFGEVIFTDAIASGPNGTYTPEGATILDIQQNGQILTSVAINGSSVAIKYV